MEWGNVEISPWLPDPPHRSCVQADFGTLATSTRLPGVKRVRNPRATRDANCQLAFNDKLNFFSVAVPLPRSRLAGRRHCVL